MQRRVIAAVAAVLLAGIGAVMLFSYVNTADARAMANLTPTGVLVVTKVVPAGTAAEDLGAYVERRELPKAAVVPDALASATDLAGLVATTDLQVGEQLLKARFGTPGVSNNGEVDVPKDLQQFTIQLAPSRVIGTNLAAGDKVALFISKEQNQVGLTKLALRDVLVTRIQGAPDAATADGQVVPSGDVLVTLALKPAAATQVVWATEFGSVWLALEPEEGDHDSRTIVKVKNVFG